MRAMPLYYASLRNATRWVEHIAVRYTTDTGWDFASLFWTPWPPRGPDRSRARRYRDAIDGRTGRAAPALSARFVLKVGHGELVAASDQEAKSAR